LDHAGKYRTEDKLLKKQTIQKRKQHKTKQTQNYPGSVAFYDTRQGNEVALFHKYYFSDICDSTRLQS